MSLSPHISTTLRPITWARSLGATFDWRLILQLTIGLLWLSISCGGLVALAIYSNAPGPLPVGPAQWPIKTSLRLSETGTTLIMFAHPKCPCTRASLGELEKIVARSHGSVTPWVVFFKPTGSEERWEQTDLWTTAAAIPGCHIVSDRDGVEARRFHATTSGETLLYNARGELLFNGGITLARGHAGDNAGSSAIVTTSTGSTSDVPSCRQTPTFGCPIAHPPSKSRKISDVDDRQ